jgi:hypothetical protein
MIIIILALLTDIITLLIIFFTKVSSFIQHLIALAPTIGSAPHQLLCLRAQRSALVIQRDILVRQLTDIEDSIALLEQASTPSSTAPISMQPPSSLVPTTDLIPTSPQRSYRSPSRVRCQPTGRLHPLPYTPPRTPEEVRRNEVTLWINDLITKNNNKNK